MKLPKIFGKAKSSPKTEEIARTIGVEPKVEEPKFEGKMPEWWYKDSTPDFDAMKEAELRDLASRLEFTVAKSTPTSKLRQSIRRIWEAQDTSSKKIKFMDGKSAA